MNIRGHIHLATLKATADEMRAMRTRLDELIRAVEEAAVGVTMAVHPDPCRRCHAKPAEYTARRQSEFDPGVSWDVRLCWACNHKALNEAKP